MEAKDIRGKLPDRKQHNPKHTPRLLTSAVRGFFRSIALAPQGKSLQVLRVRACVCVWRGGVRA
jgi:hypothetical protein